MRNEDEDGVKKCARQRFECRGSHRVYSPKEYRASFLVPQKPGGVSSPCGTMLITLYFVPISSGDAKRTID